MADSVKLAVPGKHTTYRRRESLGIGTPVVFCTSNSKGTIMPNQTTFVDERTSTKALRALTKDNALDLDQALGAVERLQEAGLLIREPMRKDAGAATTD